MAKAKFYKSELTVSETNAKNKNFLGVLISILVLLLISSMIVAAIVIINPEIVNMTERQEPREAFTLEETMLGELYPMGFAYQWTKTPPGLPGQEPLDEILFEDMKNLNLMTLPPTTSRHSSGGVKNFMATVTSLVKNSSLLASIDFSAKLSPSHRYLLIATAKKRQFRHSSTARYYLYDNKQDLILMLSTKQASSNENPSEQPTSPPHNSFEQLDSAVNYLSGQSQFEPQAQQQTRFQIAEWFSSNGRDSLVLIQDNNIYLVPDVGAHQQSSAHDLGAQVRLVKVTHTGKPNEIWNGVPDWLYEEEILSDVPAYDISPDGATLAYMSFNDSQVDLMPLTFYGSSDQILPTEQRIRYPKAGRVNPRVTVHLVDGLTMDRFDEIELQLPEELARQQHYIFRIKWLSSDHFSIIWLNRSQNEASVVICKRQNQWMCEKNIAWATQDGWLDILNDELTPLDEHHYLAPLPKFEGDDVGSFKHLAKVSLRRPNEITFLTSGRREVISVEGVNLRRGLVYYIATPNGEAGQRQAYTVQVDAPEREGQSPNCLTCSHYPTECLYNSISMSPSANYYIFECEGPAVPRTELRSSLSKVQLPPVSDGSSDFIAQKNPNLINLPSWTFETGKWANALHKKQQQQQKLNKTDPRSRSLDDLREEDSKEESGSLLWSIQDNQFLKDELTHKKAMPLTVRVRVPIANTSYKADVLLMLPPQLGSTFTFRGPTAALSPSDSNNKRQRRNALPATASGNQLDRDLYGHQTLESISEYMSRVSPGHQYPMVVDVYAGPGSQKVDYRFNINFGHYLTSARRTIYCMIDGRGSGFQGTKRLYEIYHKFGTVEIQDQIDTASYLARNLSFIDSGKVAIWGWSYGGYVAAMALAKSNAARVSNLRQQKQLQHNLLLAQYHSAIKTPTNSSTQQTSSSTANGRPLFLTQQTSALPGDKIASGIFECAASVAPVTNWIYYDTAYTERYMSSPYVNEHYDLISPGDHKPRQAPISPFLGRSMAEIDRQNSNKWFRPNSTSDINHRLPFSDFWTARSPVHQVDVRPSIQMDSADLNDRYRTGSLLEFVGDIDRKRFLLMHGTADDNVHFQQSIMLMKQMIQKNIMYDMRVYPDQDHSIGNRGSKLHLATSLSNFFTECFEQ